MTEARGRDEAATPATRQDQPEVTVLAILADEASRAVLTKVVPHRLHLSDDLTQAVALAEKTRPDVAFVEVGLHDGGGLALVHHLKAVLPAVTVYALSSRRTLETAANAVALGGAGLIVLPLGGDEVLSAIETVKAKLGDALMRAELARGNREVLVAETALAKSAALASASSRTAAAEQLIAIVTEATGASGAAVYTLAGHQPSELTRAAASPGLQDLPRLTKDAEIQAYAARAGLRDLPLVVGATGVGRLLVSALDASRRAAALLDAITAQAAAAFALLGEHERAGGAAIKDPASSAYSFAYYVDVAGREIARAQRYSRRFAIATVAFEVGPDARQPPMSHAEMADQLLKAARDTDVLAQVDEHEFHLLMPETDGLAAHASRRRILARIAERSGRALPDGLLIGVATYPHDGTDLSQILRNARRRAEATRYSLVRRLAPDQSGLTDLLDAVGWDIEAVDAEAIFAARHVSLPVTEAAALGSALVTEAVRGGSALIVIASNDQLGVGSAIRAALPAQRDNVTIHSVDLRAAGDGEAIEAVAILAEHGTYALFGRNDKGLIHGIHAADPLLADVLAERLGRAAGLRLLT